MKPVWKPSQSSQRRGRDAVAQRRSDLLLTRGLWETWKAAVEEPNPWDGEGPMLELDGGWSGSTYGGDPFDAGGV